MRKLLFYTGLIILIALTGCTDFSSSGADSEDLPVVIEFVERGEIVQNGEIVDIEYTVGETELVLNSLVITLTGPDAEILSVTVIEEEPLTGWANPLEFGESLDKGLYTIRFDFFSGEELFYSELREFFVTPMKGSIRSIASYPPVLYPGGGGLIHAQTDCTEGDCWMRWTLDDAVIAEGTAAEGYESIEIQAPDSEGVYDIRLEIFPVAPEGGLFYDFESTVIKEAPLYVNTEQKSGVNEFGSAEDFYTLFHFRGNLINSADTELSGIESLSAEGAPSLSVRNGMFGYILDSGSYFNTDSLMLPVTDGELQGFSVMASFIPLEIPAADEDEQLVLLRTQAEDGSIIFETGVYSDGRMIAELQIGDEQFALASDAPVIFIDAYTSVSAAVLPGEDSLRMMFYVDGVRIKDEVFYVSPDSSVWTGLNTAEKAAETVVGGGFKLLIDEAGLYFNESSEGIFIDPEQFRRSMELEYGKFLMYAEGFDSIPAELVYNDAEISVENSILTIPPGAAVDFPPLYPGYEEVVFKIELADSSAEKGAAVIYVDGGSSEIVTIDFPSSGIDNLISFGLLFSQDEVLISGSEGFSDREHLEADFSSMGYSIVNYDAERSLMIENIVVTRKNVSISEAEAGAPGEITTEIKIRS